MLVTEFQPQNPCVFQDGVFPIEREETLEQIHDPDDTKGGVSVSSGCRQV